MQYDYSAYIAGDAPSQDVFIAVETARALDAQARAEVTPPWISVTLDSPVAVSYTHLTLPTILLV